MQFEGEHLLPGQWGHFFVLIAFVSSLLASAAYLMAVRQPEGVTRLSWLRYARWAFGLQTLAVFIVFGIIFYICANHYIEYLYAYKHTSRELEFKYLLACIWEDQSGSFMLWSICHSLLGLLLIRRAGSWEAPVMMVVSLAQVFLAMMIMGVYIFGTKIGNSPFVLTRNEINGPIFSRPEYLSLIKDGVGLNVLLRNYWMVIHPPVLFLGFAATLVPFAYAVGGLITRRYTEWVKPALPYALFAALVLGAGIMMGGKWAYESLSFGGYWAWDPVENASLVPWLILVAGIHTLLVFNATGHSLRATYLFLILAFVFVLYSTFLTRTGILGDTSVHAFTEAGSAMNILIFSFLVFFTAGSLALFFVHYRRLPAVHQEEGTNTREFWMFIGSLVLFLSALFIIGKTSMPVVNAVFKTNIAPAEDVEFSYNKVMVLVAVVIGVLTAVTQYFRYRTTPRGEFPRKMVWPTVIAAVLTLLVAILYPIVYYRQGAGFLAALYVAFFAAVYAVVANAAYIRSGLRGNFKAAGGSLAHLGFALMIAGMIVSAGNKKIISEEKYKAFALPTGIDPLTKQQDNPAENINLIRQVPTRMGDYEVTYLNDSSGHESGRNFYHLLFEKKAPGSQKVTERFVLSPDVYIMKGNSMSSNPDTRSYLTHDVFTYISYVLNPEKAEDTSAFKLRDVREGDTIFYSNGYMIYNGTVKNPASNKFNIKPGDLSVLADLTVVTKDSTRYRATPMLYVEKIELPEGAGRPAGLDSMRIVQVDDTVYAQNLHIRFAGVAPDQQMIQIAWRETDAVTDFVTLKAYIFPYINFVWIGLILMSVGIMLSVGYRARFSPGLNLFLVAFTAISLLYMFLFAAS